MRNMRAAMWVWFKVLSVLPLLLAGAVETQTVTNDRAQRTDKPNSMAGVTATNRVAAGPNEISVNSPANAMTARSSERPNFLTPQEITVFLPGNITLVMVKIPAGTFQMGSPTTERSRVSDETLHQVTLTSVYYMGKYEVTQGQWKALMGSNPSYFSSCGDDCPVERVSWDDIRGADGFIARLNAYSIATSQAGTGNFRLPTEAEWERAARGGTQTRFSFGDALECDDSCGMCSLSDQYMWWCANSDRKTHAVGSKNANTYGLFDMHGNVWEWVEDTYGAYPSTPQTDPLAGGNYVRVFRGGASTYEQGSCRSAVRRYDFPSFSNSPIGFRLAMSVGGTAVTCTSFTASPVDLGSASGGGSGVVTVTGVPAGCTGGSWAASSNASWLSVSPTAGTGSGSVTVTYAANTGSTRTGTATIAGNTVTVTQTGTLVRPCTSYTLSPATSSPTSGAGSTSVTITGSPAGCTSGSWTAVSNASWLSLSPASGTASGSVTVTYEANTGAARSGTVTIAGQTFTVNQAGGCVYTLNPTSVSAAGAGETGKTFQVQTTSGCVWTAISNANWITIAAGASGTGTGTVTYNVAANTGSVERTGIVTAGGQWFSVIQTAGVPNPSIQSFSASPASITAGQLSTLSWSVSNATALSIDNNVGDVTGKSNVNVTPSNTTTYTLTATNSSGSTTAKATTVEVVGPPTFPLQTSNYNLANVSKSADEFTIWMDIHDSLELRQPANEASVAVMTEMSEQGPTAPIAVTVPVVPLSCYQVADQGGVHHRCSVTLKVKKAPNGVPYFEGGTLWITRTRDGATCRIPASQLKISVHGTDFNMERHAFKFKNGAWGAKLLTSRLKLDFFRIAAALEQRLGAAISDMFLDSWAGPVYEGYFQTFKGYKPAGLCAGMVYSAIANYTHRDEKESWGPECSPGNIEPVFCPPWASETNNSYLAQIDERAALLKTSSDPKRHDRPFASDDIYSSLSSTSDEWTPEAMKKLSYYHVTQQYSGYLGTFNGTPSDAGVNGGESWVGKGYDGPFSLKYVVGLLKSGNPVSLGFNLTGVGLHAVLTAAAIEWSVDGMNHAKLIIYDPNFPLSSTTVLEWAPFREIWLDASNQEPRNVSLCLVKFDSGEGDYDFHVKGLDGCHLITDLTLNGSESDYQHIYKRVSAATLEGTRGIDSMVVESSKEPEQLPADQAYIDVRIIGASSAVVSDALSGQIRPLITGGLPDGVHALISQPPGGIYIGMRLPSAGGLYRIDVTKEPLAPRLAVFVNSPSGDTGVDFVKYDDIQTSPEDETRAYFLVGASNSDKTLWRLRNGSYEAVAPRSVGSAVRSVPPISGLYAELVAGGILLRWTNPADSRFERVDIRQGTEPPAGPSDGTLIYSGRNTQYLHAVQLTAQYGYLALSYDSNGQLVGTSSVSISSARRCISGSVTSAVSSAVADAAITVRGADARAYQTLSDRDGHFAICDLLPGTYTITCSKAGFTFPSQNAILGANNLQLSFSAPEQKTITVTSPNGGEAWSLGSSRSVSWRTTGTIGDVDVDLSTDSGSTWTRILTTAASAGASSWAIPNSVSQNCLVRVSASDGSASDMSDSKFSIVLATSRTELLLSKAKVSVRVEWRSQYSGQTGTAISLPQGDNFGFFYFSDPANPEVFVKVLDFGGASPFLLFYSGLTDFEYKVTYTNTRTGQKATFTKPAGSSVGGGDNTSLPHIVNAALWDGDSATTVTVPNGFRLEEALAGSSPEIGSKIRPLASSIPHPNAAELLLSKGTVAVTVSYRNQYSGQTGTAQALPQGDQFGFFYFSDPGNPEVFIKVLDWGSDKPYLIFYAGLTDFEYIVSYRQVQTGQVVSFKKTAGTYNGGADNTALQHGPPCIVPSSVPRVSLQGSSPLVISWTSSAGATGYQLLRNGSEVYKGSGTSFSETPSVRSCYKVRAYNLCGNTDYSSEVCWEVPACTYSLSSTSVQVGALAGSGSFAVAGTPSGCSGGWGASSGVTWLTVSPMSGSGSGPTNLSYSWQTNTSTAARTATITAAGSGFTVTQAGTSSTADITVNLPGNVPLVMVKIPKGTFWMGSPITERSRLQNEWRHQVTLTQDYYMEKYEVTQEQWQAVMGTPMPTACGGYGTGANYPVYCVRWNDIAGAGGFLEKLNAHLTATGQAGAGKFRLPTEAEWERAARAGTDTRFSFGDALLGFDDCDSNAEADPYVWWCGNWGIGIHPVGTKNPNGYGLHDMHGNVFELVQDWYGNYGPDDTDPVGPASGLDRVCRGNSGNYLQNFRSASRYGDSGARGNIGFRLARSQ